MDTYYSENFSQYPIIQPLLYLLRKQSVWNRDIPNSEVDGANTNIFYLLAIQRHWPDYEAVKFQGRSIAMKHGTRNDFHVDFQLVFIHQTPVDFEALSCDRPFSASLKENPIVRCSYILIII